MSIAPTDPLRPLTVTRWEPLASDRLWRVHADDRDADAFFSGIGPRIAPTRFAPIHDRHGTPIDVLYAGLEPPGALFETVFHDVPATGIRRTHIARLRGRVLTRLALHSSLHLADFTKLGLPSLGTTRVELIESDAVHYATTAHWSAAVHQDNDTAQGLYWISRQNDRCEAVQLYRDRVPDGTLTVTTDRTELWHGAGLNLVAHWADRADIDLI